MGRTLQPRAGLAERIYAAHVECGRNGIQFCDAVVLVSEHHTVATSNPHCGRRQLIEKL